MPTAMQESMVWIIWQLNINKKKKNLSFFPSLNGERNKNLQDGLSKGTYLKEKAQV